MPNKGPSQRAGLSPGQLRVIIGLAAVALVVAYVLYGDAVKQRFGIGTDAPPRKAAGSVRVVSWNLRNFPSEGQDLEALSRQVSELSPEVVAFQEVHDASALEELFPDYEFVHTTSGGRGEQFLAIGVVRRGTIVDSTEHEELTMGGSVRPALAATVEVDTRRFEVMTVHLKATPDGHSLRERQWVVLEAITRAARQDGDPLLLLGDFNATGAPGGDPADERNALADALVPLEPLFPPSGCSAYWEGSRRDAWKEPSLLDLGFVAGVEGRAIIGGACGAHRCAPIRSTPEYPNPTYEDLSDHCPLIFDLSW